MSKPRSNGNPDIPAGIQGGRVNRPTGSQILALRARTVEVDVPELGGPVTVRGLSSVDRDWLDSLIAQHGDLRSIPNARALLTQRCVLDEGGRLMFLPNEVPKLAEVPAEVLDPIVLAVLRLSGMTKDSNRVQVGNLPTGNGESSSSDSAGSSDTPTPII